MSAKKCVMIIAGEASGDHHGAKLVNAIKKKTDKLSFCGIGGQALKNEGVKILVDASELAVVGITEVFHKITGILKGLSIVKRALKTMRPDLLILIDFPDFNLNLAATAKKLSIPVLYYISPQVWAWRSGRVKKIGKLVNHVAVILPFEADFYKRHQIPVTFVGHPLLDNDPVFSATTMDRQAESKPIVGLLPGSRDGEIARHLPVMLDAAQILSERIKDIKFIISLAPDLERHLVEAVMTRYEDLLNFEKIEDGVDKVLERCTLVVTASGTVTLESAISGTPMVIIYKLSPISYWLGRALVRVQHIGLVNLIAGKRLAPELLQGEASPEKIADTVYKMLNDAPGLARMRKELLKTKDALGEPGASERVADLALNIMASA